MSKNKRPEPLYAPPENGEPVGFKVMQTVVVELPVADIPVSGFQSKPESARHVDLTLTGVTQTEALMMLKAGLLETEARLENGRLVQTYSDVIRYVLEKIGRGV